MILWTIQTEEAWEQLNKKGCITGVMDYIEPSWLSSYHWMMQQMKDRIGSPPCKHLFPVWAWYQWDSSNRKKPDLRSAGHLPKNVKGVRIEFSCDKNAGLLSDFTLWHYVLNYWYLPESMADDEKFDAEIKKQGTTYFEAKPHPTPKIHQKIVRSWNKIFDLDWDETDISVPKYQKSIQATIWQLRMEQVRSCKHFKAR